MLSDDVMQGSGVRYATIVFVCALVAMDLQFSYFLRDSGAVNATLLNSAKILLFGVLGYLIFKSLGKRDSLGFRAPLLSHDWMFMIWACVLLASLVWSVSASTTISATVPLIVVWLVTLFLCKIPADDTVKIIVVVAALAAVLSLASIPVLGSDFAYQTVSSTGAPELRGIFQHQLRLGAFMALALGLIFVAALNGKFSVACPKPIALAVLVVIVLVGTLLLSRARLYVAFAVIAALLTFLLSRRGSKNVLLVLAGIATGGFIAVFLHSILARLEDIGFDTTLTGRTEIWRGAMNGITGDSLWFGHGFGTFKLPDFDYLYPALYRASHAHSSYLQALFESGIVGLAALIALVVVQLIVAWRFSVKSNQYSYSLFLVLYTALASLTGLNYAGPVSALFGLMMLFLAIETRAAVSATLPSGPVGFAESPSKGRSMESEQVRH